MAFEKIKVANPIVEMDGKISLSLSLALAFLSSDLIDDAKMINRNRSLVSVSRDLYVDELFDPHRI